MIGTIFVLVRLVYFLPTCIAAIRETNNAEFVYRLNCWLGWFPPVWCVLLIAAVAGSEINEEELR